MWQLLKRSWCVLLLAAGVESASAFSILGPIGSESWQQTIIGHNAPGDVATVKNLGEEYRWNTPVLNYAYDQNFLDYFGSNGVVAVEEAIAIMNALPKFSQMSDSLAEFPLAVDRVNFRAQALGLLDLKAVALHLILEELGLGEPARFTWTLHDREVRPGGTCPQDMVYTVIKRNFDPVTLAPSSLVNGALFSYVIIEVCTGSPVLADAVEFPVDPLTRVTSVAELFAVQGVFFSGLTRDDVGGLRYLMRTNNMNVEAVDSNALLFATNNAGIQILSTSNLTELAEASFTNSAAQLRGIFTNLVINSTVTFFSNVVQTNFVAFFTNLPSQSPGDPAILVTNSVLVTNIEPRFIHSFANVVTNTFYTNGFVSILETNIFFPPGQPAGTVQTNVTSRTVVSNFVNGDYYIIPANLCAYHILSNQLVRVIGFTNTVLAATNGVTNLNNQAFSRSSVTFLTNNNFVVFPVVCETNSVALRQGIDKVTFVRQNFDSLLGRFYQPITNRFTLTAVTNSAPIVQTFERVTERPDFFFSAQDLTSGPGDGVRALSPALRSVPGFVTNNALPTLAGPGIMETRAGVRIAFNKVGPVFFNDAPFFLDEATQSHIFTWGSFDGTTNAPIVYPIGTSITNLENQVLIQLTTPALPDGTVGTLYSEQLAAIGGQPPYTWSLSPVSGPLPDGLGISSGGLISGTPSAAGTNVFLVRLTDSSARSVDKELSIIINP